VKKFKMESLPEGELIKRAMQASRDMSKLLPIGIIDYVTRCSEILCFDKWFFAGMLLPFVFGAMPKVRTTAWVNTQSGHGLYVSSSFSALVLAETGANKSQCLSLLTKALKKYMEMVGEAFMATDFTVEALDKFMAEHEGKAFLALDEAKVWG